MSKTQTDAALDLIERALSIIWATDESGEHEQWTREACALLSRAGVKHYVADELKAMDEWRQDN